jgi:hypothetical protein
MTPFGSWSGAAVSGASALAFAAMLERNGEQVRPRPKALPTRHRCHQLDIDATNRAAMHRGQLPKSLGYFAGRLQSARP